ncbi:MAG TPA: pyridoxamine 5'-phosphate oxidase [Planctomycetota bacterium]|jgi:pyridoxamine 5'-phosphate oxidase|nr:pyridoxamine 5'-phosphate oxidase [Planctomycetota bacterium]
MSTQKTRHEYSRGALAESTAGQDPLRLFQKWFAAAKRSGLSEPCAAALATVAGSAPSVRYVLLRGADSRGFVFYTNYESRKARELERNPRAAMALWWETLERQVRIEGRVERVNEEESDAYFHSRPRSSRLSAWASPQSRVVSSRASLERKFREAKERFTGRDVPRPASWGGYRLLPSAIEFWQGRTHRLHDRFRFTRSAKGAWRRERLAP